ncbi:MAG: hypothetical protein C4325_14720, partial [Blastocatellia bacterium]
MTVIESPESRHSPPTHISLLIDFPPCFFIRHYVKLFAIRNQTHRRMIKLKVSTLLALALFLLACDGQSNGPSDVANEPQAVQPSQPVAQPVADEELALGRKIYMSNCAACHKENGTGGRITIEGKTIKPDNLTSEKIKKFDDAKIYKYIYDGVEDEGMP